MPRNKYPEETVQLILDVSLKLFMEKGYENTSIQDIIDGLGGLTKGAIYHHFKSKEDIMLAVLDRLYEGQDQIWKKILDDPVMTGLEKLRALTHAVITAPGQKEFFSSSLDMLRSPKILTLQMKSIVEESVPLILRPIIEQGVKDGSIRTSHPGELAEAILLLVNLWLTPTVFYADVDTMRRRYTVLQEMTQHLCPDVFDQALFDQLERHYNIYSEKRT